MEEWRTVVLAALAGLSYAMTGWAKNKGEEFDTVKFGSTILIGAISGIVMAVTQWDISVSYTFLINLGIVPIAENLIKMIRRKILPWFGIG